MLLRNLLILVAIFVTSCGFTPVHKQNNSVDLAAVKINVSRGLNEQFFQSHLTDLLNPEATYVPTKYNLNVKLKVSQTALAIQQDRTVTRYKTIVMAEYSLTSSKNGNVISNGTIQREGGYDKVDSDYATYVSEEDTKRRVTKELAEDMKLKIMSAILG